MKTTTNITYPVLALFALGCFALSPQARAVCREGCLSSNNTVLGDDAFFSNISGYDNTAIGFQALYNNTGGQGNTATGHTALFNNVSGVGNTATGAGALDNNIEGSLNTATGYSALGVNTTGDYNTANGDSALLLNTTGSNNTAIGSGALVNNTTGRFNIALGVSAGVNLTTGSINIDIGNPGRESDSRTIRIGTTGTHTRTFIAGISGVTVPEGVGVIVGPNGNLGTLVSSARFKDAIKPMDKASEAVLALKPVTFRYKHDLDPAGIPQFGLVAEDVEKVNPDLVIRDEKGTPYTVRYEAVNAMLLNEFLKEHRTVQELKSTVAKQEATIAQQQKDFRATAAQQQKEIQALTTGLKAQAAQIQKVSAQLEVNKTASQIVLNNQ
jgi:trimeric autotransporter adhesin